MSKHEITVIITTIGRPTLLAAVDSCGSRPVIVVGDGVPVELRPHTHARAIALGRKHGKYGSAAFNVGCGLAWTDYVTKLDDDDIFLPGALGFMEAAINTDDADLWIPGLRYNDGLEVCLKPGVWAGNVCCPTIRTDLVCANPIIPNVARPDLTDFHHIESVVRGGASIRWYGRPLIAVRPALPGRLGGGC
jgi:hypothetical protein